MCVVLIAGPVHDASAAFVRFRAHHSRARRDMARTASAVAPRALAAPRRAYQSLEAIDRLRGRRWDHPEPNRLDHQLGPRPGAGRLLELLDMEPHRQF